jgi:Zn-dependent peptidase ImmA (M78 family)
VEEGALEAPSKVSEASNDDDELRLAARISSALPTEQIRQILTLIRSFRLHQATAFDQLAKATVNHVRADFAQQRPFEQGQAAAAFVRQYIGLASVQRVDVFMLITDLGIDLQTRPVAPPSLDGLAVWGPKHGPAVLINTSSARVASRGDPKKSGAARVTAAHQLCHLLLDRGHALTAVDVLNSRMPAATESRAKAFAGEFLLPGRVAADVWLRMDRPRTGDGLRKCLRRLCAVYGLTLSVAAWKLEHGLQLHDIDLAQQLDQIVPQRWQGGP